MTRLARTLSLAFSAGVAGLELGTQTPLLVLVLTSGWGVVAALWLRLADGGNV